MSRPLDVCVRGDGIVGHVLALLLARERLRVGLVAPAAPSAKSHPDVRAYALNRQSRELLDGLRCWPAADKATPVLNMDVREAGGGSVGFSAARQGEPALAWIVDVPELESRLADAVRFQSGIEVLEEPAPARLTAVCEGRTSAARQQYGVDWDVSDYGQWAIAARVRAAVPHGQTACQWFTPTDVLGFLPLDGEHGNSLALVWSLDKEKHGQMLALEAPAFEQQLQQASANRFGALSLISERVSWPLQLATARRWVGAGAGGSWVLAGDAAHVVHPLAGQGLNLGLADVQELAHQVRSRDYWREVNDARLLRRYERARKVDVWLMGATTDSLQRLFAQSGPFWQGVRQWGMGGFETVASSRTGWRTGLWAEVQGTPARSAQRNDRTSMNAFNRLLFAAGLALLAWAVQAQEATIRKNLGDRISRFQKIEGVAKSPIPGLYEVWINRGEGIEMYYSDAQGNMLIQGSVLDTKLQRNLTEERVMKLSAINFDSLVTKDAITIVRGNGKRQLAIFEDPNCGYCKQFEASLQKVDNVTIYLFLFPILGPDSGEKSKNIWCSKDPGKTWMDWMVHAQAIGKAATPDCDVSAIARNVAFGRKHNISGTPTLLFADGSRVPGAISAAQVEKYLSDAK